MWAQGTPFWVSLASLGLSMVLLVVVVGLALGNRRGPRIDEHQPTPDPAPMLWRSLWWLVQGLAPAVRAWLPVAWRVRLTGQLREAGLELALTPSEYIAGRALFALLAAVLAALLAPPDLRVTCILLAGIAVWVLPASQMQARIRLRRLRIKRDLPVILDLIGLAVQAGSTMSAALGLAVERAPAGPMREELARVIREIRAGRSRQEALRAMAERTDLSGLRHAVAAMITAERQGADLSPVLRAQAAQRREERFIDAEQRAMQAPVKLLFPLVVFIFPGTFLILLFPVIMQILAEGILP